MDRFDNYLNFNNQKRLKLVESYFKATPFGSNLAPGNEALTQFEAFLFEQRSQEFKKDLTTDDQLIDITIQYALLYLEEYNYELKTKGLSILDHLVSHSTSSQLNFNLRSRLVYNSVERYANDKENIEFMEGAIQFICKLLAVMEPKSLVRTHSYKQHSILIESLMNNAFMTTNIEVKMVYYRNFVRYLCQIGT